MSFISDVKGNSDKLFFILGPCVIESEEHNLKIAEFLKNLSEKLKFNFVFKSSFDKANRIALKSYRGVGVEKGLQILSRIRSEFKVPVITDVHESCQISEVANVADILQIPAYLCRQTDLLLAAGKTNKVIHIKKGQFLSPAGIEHAVKKVESAGSKNIWICERGYTFGYNNLIVDYRNFKIMKNFGKPIVFDATHSVQMPGGQGTTTGGDRTLAIPLAISAVAQGIAGIFMEVHDNPEQALSDGPNSIRLSQLEDIIKYLLDLDAWVKSRKLPEVS